MRKFLCLAGMVLAGLVSANSADAAFVLIDDFNATAESGFVRSPVSGFSASGGRATFTGTRSGAFGTPAAVEYDVVVGGDLSGTDALRLNDVIFQTGGATNVSALAAYSTDNGLTYTTTAGVFDGDSYNFAFGTDLGGATDLQLAFSAIQPSSTFNFSSASLTAVPEPTTMALLGLASISGGGAYLRRRRKAVAC